MQSDVPVPPAPHFGSLYRTLGLSIAMPLIVIQVALHHGVAPLYALAFATVFPLIEMAYEVVTARHIGVIALVSLIGIVVGFGLSFATGNAVFALLKDSVLTGTLPLATATGASPIIAVVVVGGLLVWTVLYAKARRAAAAARATAG